MTEPSRGAHDEPGAWHLELGGRRVELTPGELLLGRGPDCGLTVPDGTVSRHHAVLRRDGDRVFVRDLGSSNGTFVNGNRVGDEAELAAGDRLRLGRVHLGVERGAAEPAGRLFCRTCGQRVPLGAESCAHCGEDLVREPPLSRSEAVAMSEVMPVGEVLATPARRSSGGSLPLGWDEPEGGPVGETVDDTDSFPGAGMLGELVDGEGESEADAEAGHPRFLPAATFFPRLAAALLEAAGLAALGYAASLAVGGPAAPRGLGVAVAVAAVAWAATSVVGWWRWGTTPGKALFRLYVCDLDGRPGVPLRRAVLRCLASLLTLATLGIGFLRAGLAADHRALHDHLSGTYLARLEGRGRHFG